MKSLLSWIMRHRARRLTRRIAVHFPSSGRIADIGSGTGHNAQMWRQQPGLTVDEFDVADLHWVGDGPTLFDGSVIPAPEADYDVATLLFVLQYPADPLSLLREAKRISKGRVIVLQSTYESTWGRFWLRLRGFVWGSLAFHLARWMRVIRFQDCPLDNRRVYSRPELRTLFTQAGLTIQSWEPQEWHRLNISRDLYRLEAISSDLTFRSSFPPATKSGG